MPHETTKRRGLGMGLSALLGPDIGPTAALPPTQVVPIEFLTPSPLQPRRQFAKDELDALAESIRAYGVLQPLLVRPGLGPSPAYEIVAGERRWRAAQSAGLHELPVVVRELGDREVIEIALVENLQRANLTPLEEAEAYRRLIDEFGRTQDEIAAEIGKSRPHIANTLRLLKLPPAVREHLEAGRLSPGHARALLGSQAPEDLAAAIIERGLSVRETEALVQAGRLVAGATRGRPQARVERHPDILAFEARLQSFLGLVCRLEPRRKGGTLTIRYSSLDQLDQLAARLMTHH